MLRECEPCKRHHLRRHEAIHGEGEKCRHRARRVCVRHQRSTGCAEPVRSLVAARAIRRDKRSVRGTVDEVESRHTANANGVVAADHMPQRGAAWLFFPRIASCLFRRAECLRARSPALSKRRTHGNAGVPAACASAVA